MARKKGTNTGIPGLSFSWKRALGVTAMRQKIARTTGIPTTKGGMQRKIGGGIFKAGGCLLPTLALLAMAALVAFM